MAVITISVSTYNGLSFSRDLLIDDADVLRILRAANHVYMRDYSYPSDEALMAKTADVFNKVVDVFFGMIRNATMDFEIEKAKIAAAASVAAIEEIPAP